MYIVKHTYPTGDNEPIGVITEHEIFESYDGEIRDAFIFDFIENQELLDSITMIDSIMENEESIDICNYFSSHEIDLLNEMFMECDEWTENQVKYILNRFTPNKEEENEVS